MVETKPRIKKPGANQILIYIKRITAFREFMLLVVIAVIFITMIFLSPFFLRPANLSSILLGLSVEATIVVGMVIVMVGKGFDLSVGSTLAWAGVATGLALTNNVPVLLSILIGLCAALLVGLINGFIISIIKVNPLVTTLSTMIIVRGLLLVAAGGTSIVNLPASFNQIGQGKLFGVVQYPIVVFLVIAVLADIILRKTRFLRQNYYIGSNEKAARISGINVDFVKIFNFALIALLAGISGIMLTARFGASSLTVGQGLELRVIAAAVIGGCSLNGGEGTVLGGVLGSLLMLLIINALNLLGVNIYWHNLITGLILLIAVIADRFTKGTEA